MFRAQSFHSLFVLSSSVSFVYLILVLMRKRCGQFSFMSSTFPISIRNGTCFFTKRDGPYLGWRFASQKLYIIIWYCPGRVNANEGHITLRIHSNRSERWCGFSIRAVLSLLFIPGANSSKIVWLQIFRLIKMFDQTKSNILSLIKIFNFNRWEGWMIFHFSIVRFQFIFC